MSQIQIAIANPSRTADDQSNGGTLVLRDGTGGINGNIITGTTVSAGTIVGNTVTETTNFTAAAATHILIDCTAGAVIMTLPPAANGNVVYTVMKKDSSGNHATLATPLGTTSLTTQYQNVTVFNDSTNWYAA